MLHQGSINVNIDHFTSTLKTLVATPTNSILSDVLTFTYTTPATTVRISYARSGFTKISTYNDTNTHKTTGKQFLRHGSTSTSPGHRTGIRWLLTGDDFDLVAFDLETPTLTHIKQQVNSS